jgi:hypothetical protein
LHFPLRGRPCTKIEEIEVGPARFGKIAHPFGFDLVVAQVEGLNAISLLGADELHDGIVDSLFDLL